MAFRLAINGFGRIGRVALRILLERQQENKTNAQIVAINDLSSPDMLAYLLKYDSVHGRFKGEITHTKHSIKINGQEIQVTSIKEPRLLPWKDLQVDVVLEASGFFLSREGAGGHLEAGAKKVLLSAPAKDDGADITICYGVNHHQYKKEMKIVSTASCTTNCIAPVAKVLNESLGIKKASVTTVHSYTNDQRILDLAHEDKRRARAAALSMIPTTTGAAKAISLVLPELSGKFHGLAIRVPTPNVSLIDMVAQVAKKTSTEEINHYLKEAASSAALTGILGYCDEPIVSVDMLGTSCSSIVDSLCTMVVDGDLVKVLSWYDNEWGFTNRAIDVLEMLGQG